MLKSGCKNNHSVKKSIFTGILKIAKENLFSDLNNFREYTVLDSEFANYFGFTEANVEMILKENLVTTTSEEKAYQISNLKLWYNGYQMGTYTMFNPWSVMNCLATSKHDPLIALRPYWTNTGGTALIEDAFTRVKEMDNLDRLMKTGYCKMKIANFIDVQELNKNDDALFTLLLHSGYLTKSKYKDIYKIPNHEVRIEFYNKFYPLWVKLKFGAEVDYKLMFKEFASAIENKDNYKEALERYINKVKGVTLSERFFRAIVDGGIVFSTMNPETYRHSVFLEDSNIFGKRYDTMLTPNVGLSTSVLIYEYKILELLDKLEDLIDDALWQLYINNYLYLPLKGYATNKYSHWKTIIARVIILYKDEAEGNWAVHITEHRYTLEQAKRVSELFTVENDGKRVLFDNHQQFLTANKEVRKRTRSDYLSKHNANDINELLEKLVKSDN